MLNFLNKLNEQLTNINTQINGEENKFKLIDLNIERDKITNTIKYCFDLIFSNFADINILDFAKENIDINAVDKALEDTEQYNEIILGNMIKKSEGRKNELLAELNSILEQHPNIENIENRKTNEYQRVISIRNNIRSFEVDITNTKKKKQTFIDNLDVEQKINLVGKLIEKHADEETIDTLLKEAMAYKPNLDLLRDAKFPVAKRFKELTENKNDSLSEYLLSNEEVINRLTVISSNDIVSSFYTQKVNKIEGQLAKERLEEFTKATHKNGIADIANHSLGLFDNKKVYSSKEDYDRYMNCVKEIKVSTNTKEKIKKILKKLDSLGIVDEHASANESQYKEYGFIRFILAKEAFINAMNENPIDEEKIKNTLENLKREEAKIVEMYDIIEKELGDDYHSMPLNVDSYRNTAVPPCFKNNLAINAKFNSLYIMLTFIKEKNLDIDQFVEKPVTITNQCIQDFFEQNNLDVVLKGKTKAEAIDLLLNSEVMIKSEDAIKYSRSFEMIYSSEPNEEYRLENEIILIAVNAYQSDVHRPTIVAKNYFLYNSSIEAVQNIFMAKPNANGEIPYSDCYIGPRPIQDDMKTGLLLDEKATIVEKIHADQNIENTFYEALDTLKKFVVKNRKNGKNNFILDNNKMFYAVQELATKIIVSLDLKIRAQENNRNYSSKFIEDVFNVIIDYKKVESLNGFKFALQKNKIRSMSHVIKHKEELIKDVEKQMNVLQNAKEEQFIAEFTRINKEIDQLDARADKLGKKLQKGTTNKAIEDIMALQHQKFLELRELQNNRIKELKDDVKNGLISKYYFEKRSEQILLLENINSKPAMFMCDDKNYKNFKTYMKEVKQINVKGLSSNELIEARNSYETLMKQSRDEKRLYLINNVLNDYELSPNKSINYQKVREIIINDHTEEIKKLSDDLLLSDQLIKEANEQALLANNKQHIQVNAEEVKVDKQEELLSDEVVKNEKSVINELF